MEEFTRQIIDDISIIKRDFAHIDEKILENDYAFNYWVLSRLYNIDEELISSYVTEEELFRYNLPWN